MQGNTPAATKGANMDEMELRYLRSLSKQYPNIAAASTEIINLQAILNLPKGTEHFMTDIHGEYEQFNHILKNGSGSVRRKIDEEFGNTLSNKDKKSLATLIYYPKEKLELILKEEDNIEDLLKKVRILPNYNNILKKFYLSNTL